MKQAPAAAVRAELAGRTALFFVVLFGFLSLFSDMTYEGARSITGPYLRILGASATAVGIVAGLGELIGNVVRLGSGFIADTTRRYWVLAILGYAVNLLVVPFIALAGSWPVAACLIVIERFGKAIRKPSGDTMLSFAREKVGSGWTYGLQEAMDKVGAVSGPVIVAGILYFRNDNYRLGFAVLGIPAIVALAIVFVTRFLYPDPSNLEVKKLTVQSRGFDRHYWLYLLAVGFVAMGYADWALVAYHFQAKKLFADAAVPLLYALAMGVDAVSAIVFGRLYDRIGPGASPSRRHSPRFLRRSSSWADRGLQLRLSSNPPQASPPPERSAGRFFIDWRHLSCYRSRGRGRCRYSESTIRARAFSAASGPTSFLSQTIQPA